MRRPEQCPQCNQPRTTYTSGAQVRCDHCGCYVRRINLHERRRSRRQPPPKPKGPPPGNMLAPTAPPPTAPTPEPIPDDVARAYHEGEATPLPDDHPARAMAEAADIIQPTAQKVDVTQEELHALLSETAEDLVPTTLDAGQFPALTTQPPGEMDALRTDKTPSLPPPT